MPEYPINLGRNNILDAPCDVKSSEPTTYYPSLYLSELPEGTELPESGEITLKFKLCRESEDYKNNKCSADIEVLAIVSVKGDEEESESAGSAFDRIAEEIGAK